MSDKILNRKDRKKKNSRFKNINITKRQKVMIVVVIILSLIAFFVYSQVIKPLVAASNPVSILLVGSDTNEYRKETKKGTKPEKTDSLMVLTFNPDTYRFVTTSIPRDTAVDDSCQKQRAKINEVYAINGNDMGCLKDSVSNYLNVPIDYYAKVNLDQIKNIIDEVGPLEIVAHAQDGVISQANVDLTNNYTWYDGTTYQMDADEALTYARARHDSEVDYGRGKRQQQVLKTMAKNILSNGFDFGLIQKLFKMVDTDMELLLIKEYSDYAKEFSNISKLIGEGKLPNEEDLPKSAWSNMKDYFEYKKSDIKKFEKYLMENYSKEEIGKYFFESIQIVNDTYNGFYVTDDEQRKEISNQLRENLGLKEKTPEDYQYDFAVNSFPCEVTSTNDCKNGGLSTEDGPSKEDIENANKDKDKEDTSDDKDTSTDDKEVIEDQAPTISTKVNSLTINVGESVDYSLFGIIASDNEDGDLSASVVIDDSLVDINTAGTYNVVISVTDSKGQTTTSTLTVVVLESETPEVPDTEIPTTPEA